MISSASNSMTREAGRQARLTRAIERVQVEIATGTRLQRAADDPAAAARVARIDREGASAAAWLGNIETASARIQQADTVTGTATSLVIRARELLLTAASGSSNSVDRQAVATEIDALAAEVNNLAGARAPNGDFLFANGTAEVVRFDADTAFAPIPSRRDVFEVGGNPIVTWLAEAANAARQSDAPAMNAGLVNLNSAISQLSDQRSIIGVAGSRLERLTETLEAEDVNRASERSSLADTDLSEAISQLNAKQLNLEAARAAFARTSRQTLFDYLR
jgi:flagellar hook-associated protein 3 FlgL